MTDIRIASRAGIALVTLASAAGAQVLLTSKVGDKANDRLGACLRSAGDVNNDGRPDYIAGAPEDGNVLGFGEGFARVFSGATGAILYTFNGTSNADRFGTWVDGAGDVNNDGFADVVVGAPQVSTAGSNRGRVTVHSGATGAVLWTFDGAVNQDRLGTIVAGVGDVNGDGRPDVLSASRDAAGGGTQRGIVRVYSGLTGAILHTINGTANSQRLGLAADGMGGDVNGDGRADFVVSSLTAGVKVYSGMTGGVLYTLTAPSNDDLFGASVASIADLTGDGVRDLLVGATQDGNIFNQGVGYVRLYNGATGAFVRTHLGSTIGDRFGIACGDAGDLNGDGKSEILVGADQFNNGLPGFVRVFDGATGAALHTYLGASNGNRFGATLDGLGDVDGVAGLEVGIGAPEHMTAFQFQGRVELWTTVLAGCPTPYTYCGAANNSTGFPALISNTGTVSIGANNFALVASGLPPNTSGVFYYGSTEIQQTFGNGYRCVGGSTFRLGVQQASAGGVMTRPIDFTALVGPAAITAGSTRKFQCWYRNPAGGGAGFNLSNGLSATFCN